MMDNNSLAFTKLKPLCVNFINDCTTENIDALENVVNSLDSKSIDSLKEYVALPFMVHLKKKSPERITIRCIDFLTLIFKKGKVRNWGFYLEIFVLMISKICNLEDMNQVSNVSEELKISVCENVLCLVQSSTEEVLNEVYSSLSFRPYLAQAFFVFKVLLRNEKSKALLKSVLRVIGGLVYSEDYVGKKCAKTEAVASEAVASFLPGLSSALYWVICGDSKQVHSIIIMALGLLTDLIVLTVGNESYERSMASDATSDLQNHESNKHPDIPLVRKDEAWFKSVSENLEKIVRNINSMAHYNFKVRLEFLKFANSLLFKCTKTLGNCIPVLLPSVFALSVDENEIVSSYAKELLVSLSKELESVSYATLNSIIKDNIEILTSQLIKCQFSLNEDKKLVTLKSLLGYIEVSGLSLNELLFSMTCFERIIMALITFLQFNVSELNLVEEIPMTENVEVNLVWPRKRFKFFENEDILNTICRICHSLGHIRNARLLFDYLLEKISDKLYTLQSIFVIGNVIKGLAKEPDASQKYSTLISDVLEMFLSPSLFDVKIHTKDTEEKEDESVALSNNTLHQNKLQVCLILEAIANCSECLRTDFQFHLKRVLYRVMEKTGSSNYVISQCGQICLYCIAQFCEYKSVRELIKVNADYIINVITIDFHQYLYKPEMALVLRVAMELSDAEALVLFRDLIFQILDFLDYNQAKALPLLNVLFSVILCIKKWFPSKKYSQRTNTCSVKPPGLKTLVAEYIALKKSCCFESENEERDVNEDDHEKGADSLENKEHVSDGDYDVDESKKNVPLHVTVTCEIFKRCIHLQSSQNRFIRMLTLEIVEQCILILCDYEKQLHPLIHEFWSPFLRRFLEDTFVLKAFSVLLAIVKECADFVRSRTLKNVMPKLVLFLKKEYSKSLLKCNFKQYLWTNDHSLQVLILSEIGNLCVKLDIDDKDVNAVATACLPYLEKKQPKVLQDAAAKSLDAIATVHSDSLWFYWNVSFCEEKVLRPPHEELSELTFPYSNNDLTSVNINL